MAAHRTNVLHQVVCSCQSDDGTGGSLAGSGGAIGAEVARKSREGRADANFVLQEEAVEGGRGGVDCVRLTPGDVVC